MVSRSPGREQERLVIVRRPEVERLTGYSRSSIYLRITEGLLPGAVALGRRAVGWPLHEIEAVNAARIAGHSDDEVRELVARLAVARTTGPEAA